MGRKRKRAEPVVEKEIEVDVEEEEEEDVSSKKKSKKVKRRRRTVPSDEGNSVNEDSSIASHRPLTLKIKLGGNEVIASTSDQLSIGEESLRSSSQLGEDWGGSEDVSPEDMGSIQQDEEEEAWLNALETGSVNERGYLPKSKDPNAMTARQRAMLGSKEEELLELPLMRKQNEVESEEMLLKKTERNKKRRLQAIKRREKHKADTVQRLLQKQTTKKKEEEKKVTPQVSGPHIRYINNTTTGTTLSYTEGLNYPLEQQAIKNVSFPTVQCHMCTNSKRYSDSKTKLPLCSLECYQKLNSSSSSNTVTVN